MQIVSWIGLHWLEVLGGISALCLGAIPIFQLIPGPQPEKFLQGVVDFIKKFSVKP